MDTYAITKGSVSILVTFRVENSSVTTGAGLTGLAFGTSGLIAYYYRDNASSANAIPLVTMTAGSFVSGGFIEIDAAHMPGVYQLAVPNPAFAFGARYLKILLSGAANMKPKELNVELTAVDNQNGNTFGLAYLPQAPTQVKKNQAFANFPFLMVSSSDHVTPKTAVVITGRRSINGGAFASCANLATEISDGIYSINLAAGDLNGDVITLIFTAPGADPRYQVITTQA